MNIGAFDIARQVGFAFRVPDRKLISGSKLFNYLPGQPVNQLFCKWQLWIDPTIKSFELDYVTYELIDFPMSSDWARIYIGMVSIMQAAAYKHGAKTKGYVVKDVKKAATGNFKADKLEMIRTAKAQFPDQNIVDDNQADALWVMYLAVNDLTEHKIRHCEELF